MSGMTRFVAPRKLGLTRLEAAAYVGLTPEDFDLRVENGTLPSARNLVGHLRWIRTELDPKPIIGTIYFVGFRDYIQVGFTKNFANRLNGLQTGSPEKLVVYGTLKGSINLERHLHEVFAPLKLQGEWFRLTPDLQDWIAVMVAEGGAT